MKKISTVLALTLVLVFAFAVNAMAEQKLITPNSNTLPGNTADSYQATAPQNTTNPSYDGNYNQGFTGDLNNTTRIHSNYQLNSNACGACHAIHTGVGAYLLQWSDGQATCEACHDGTSKTYDVFGGQIAQTGKMTYGGRFDAHSSTNGSIHNVEGVAGNVVIGAAPGGNKTTPTAIPDAAAWVKSKLNTSGDSALAWGATFECLSCHDAHGKAGNGRILNPNANNWSDANQINTTTNSASILYQVDTNVANEYAAKNADNQWVWMQPNDYPFSIKVYDNVGNLLTLDTDYTLDAAPGFTKITFLTGKQAGARATYWPGLKVNMVVNNYLQATETVDYKGGINVFCGACHTDYNTEASTRKAGSYFEDKNGRFANQVGSGAYKVLTGTYNTAYRHTVGFTGHAEVDGEFGIKFEHRTVYKADGTPVTVDQFNCLSCHVAHGADEKVWTGSTDGGATDGTSGLKAQGGQGYEGYNGSEVDPRGSFLTRMPNRGVCQTCHNMKEGNIGASY